MIHLLFLLEKGKLRVNRRANEPIAVNLTSFILLCFNLCLINSSSPFGHFRSSERELLIISALDHAEKYFVKILGLIFT